MAWGFERRSTGFVRSVMNDTVTVKGASREQPAGGRPESAAPPLRFDQTGSGSSGSFGNIRGQSQLVVSDANDVAQVQLPATALLSFLVHPHLFGREELLDLSAAVDYTGKLQQLAEPDHLTANWHVPHGPDSPTEHAQKSVPGPYPPCEKKKNHTSIASTAAITTATATASSQIVCRLGSRLAGTRSLSHHMEAPNRVPTGLVPSACPLLASPELARDATQHSVSEPEVQCCWRYQHDSPPLAVGAQNGGEDEEPDTDRDANTRHAPRMPIANHWH